MNFSFLGSKQHLRIPLLLLALAGLSQIEPVKGQSPASPNVAASTPNALHLPAIIGDHMVLQQKQADPIWGWDVPGTRVTVEFAGQSKTAIAGDNGKWIVKLDPLPSNASPQVMRITGSCKKEIQDVLVGEVWVCSGQSNMGYRLRDSWNGDMEAAATHNSELRLITVPADRGTQVLLDDFSGSWSQASPFSSSMFSAVGLLYGRYLQQVLQVPVGMINNAWGGSTVDAWIRRAVLDKEARFQARMQQAAKREAELLPDNGKEENDRELAKWQVACDKAKAEHKPLPFGPPLHWLQSQKRPGNAFASLLYPILGYGIRGVIWYQGESDGNRPWDYPALFPFMIQQWRSEWNQGNFPFYWFQLPKYDNGQRAAPFQGAWAEIREAQTKALSLPNTGQAVLIDQGETSNIHPHKKAEVAARMARVALTKDYGFKLPYRSPEFNSIAISGNKATITFDCFGSRLYLYDSPKVLGFAICGTNQKWEPAQASLANGNTVEVWNDTVSAPVAVRYAWQNAPECNLFSKEGLPATPFRTDSFPLSTPEPQPSPNPHPEH